MRTLLRNSAAFISSTICIFSIIGCLRGVRIDDRLTYKADADDSTWQLMVYSGEWHYGFRFEHHSFPSYPDGLPSRETVRRYFGGEPGFRWTALREEHD